MRSAHDVLYAGDDVFPLTADVPAVGIATLPEAVRSEDVGS